MIIATRASRLALWQAHFIKQQLLHHYPDLQVELLELTTMGDKILDKPLDKVGGKGLFIKELELALLDGRADFAVHSMKDVPNDLPNELCIAAITERADPRDAFLSEKCNSFDSLPYGAVIGTCSVRRRAQLLALRPDLQIKDLRGNVDTRLNKLLRGDYDAIVLAAAGLQRLGLQSYIKEYFTFTQLLPSVAQGALGIECRKTDADLIALLQVLNHSATHACITAERAFTAHLNGDCHSPIAVYAEVIKEEIRLQGLVASLDGEKVIRSEAKGTHAKDVGVHVAKELLLQGAQRILSGL